MTAPVYVKVEKYNEINKTIGEIRGKIAEAKTILAKVLELKNQEDREVSLWQSDLDIVEQRIGQIQETLPRPDI